MGKNAMPKSKAKTAYGLLSEIRKLILEEPRRYDQEAWRYSTHNTAMAPACGTTACVAGWVVTLKSTAFEGRDWEMISDEAARILGLDKARIDSFELFDSNAAGYCGYDIRSRTRHAKRGAAHIEAFQKKYATQLKAKKV